MTDQVSRMASGRMSAPFMMLLMIILAWNPGRPVVSRMKGTRLTCGYRSILTWALGGRCNEGWTAGKGRDNGDIEVRGGTILIKDEIHACVFDLAIHHASEDWDGLLDVRVYHISQASGNCGMCAINTASAPTPIAVVLLRIHRFATDLTRCAFVGARQYDAEWSGAAGSGNMGCIRWAPVWGADWERKMA